MNSLMQKKLFHHKTHNINKEWRNGGTDRLMQAEHTFCPTVLTIKACVACLNKKGRGNGWEKRWRKRAKDNNILERNCFQ